MHHRARIFLTLLLAAALVACVNQHEQRKRRDAQVAGHLVVVVGAEVGSAEIVPVEIRRQQA